MRGWIGGLACLLAGCVAGGPVTTAGSGGAGQVATANIVADSSPFGAALNAQRRAAGLGEVGVSPPLRRAAEAHVRDMAANGFFSHRGTDGSSSADRARAAGYCIGRMGENIAQGQQTVPQVIESWMGSSGHRRNILIPGATGYGMARSGDTWVLLVGRSC